MRLFKKCIMRCRGGGLCVRADYGVCHLRVFDFRLTSFWDSRSLLASRWVGFGRKAACVLRWGFGGL